MESNLLSISSGALYTAFIVFLIATIFFGATIKDKHAKGKKGISGNIAITLTIIGFIAQVVYFITRWMASGHAPVSNMYEFVTFLGISLILAFIIIYFIYRLNVLGLFALPISMLIIAYASMFPTDISPLVPSLQSNWLFIHVITVSLSQGILAVSFVAGLIYLIHQIDQTRRSKQTTWLEIIMYSVFLALGFVIITTTFNAMDYEVVFTSEQGQEMKYHLPAIAGPEGYVMDATDKFEPLFNAPTWMQGQDAPKKFNTLIWSFIVGTILYGIVRLLLRKR